MFDLPPRAGEDFGTNAARLAGRVCAATGWSPDIFWSCTPAEVLALFGEAEPAAAMTGNDLATLMEAHPDG